MIIPIPSISRSKKWWYRKRTIFDDPRFKMTTTYHLHCFVTRVLWWLHIRLNEPVVIFHYKQSDFYDSEMKKEFHDLDARRAPER